MKNFMNRNVSKYLKKMYIYRVIRIASSKWKATAEKHPDDSYLISSGWISSIVGLTTYTLNMRTPNSKKIHLKINYKRFLCIGVSEFVCVLEPIFDLPFKCRSVMDVHC